VSLNRICIIALLLILCLSIILLAHIIYKNSILAYLTGILAIKMMLLAIYIMMNQKNLIATQNSLMIMHSMILLLNLHLMFTYLIPITFLSVDIHLQLKYILSLLKCIFGYSHMLILKILLIAL